MLLSKLSAVIFDMDGLMLDTEAIYCNAWQRAASELSYNIGDDLYFSLIGISNHDAEAILVATFGDQFPLSLFRTRWTQYWQEYVRKHGISPKSGLLELLTLLDQRHIPKVIATSTEWNETLLSLQDFVHRFDSVVTGDQVECGKPAPDLFLAAAERVRALPERCLVLEDSEAGVKAANAAGMPVIMVPDLKQPSEQIASQTYSVCSSLYEVRDLLAKYDDK